MKKGEGRTIIFLTGGGGGGGGGGARGVGKLWNRLFAEAVRTEINCMEVKIKVLAWRRKHKKTVCMWKFSNPLTPPPPHLPTLRQKNNGLWFFTAYIFI